jgi:hypothetical protein
VVTSPGPRSSARAARTKSVISVAVGSSTCPLVRQTGVRLNPKVADAGWVGAGFRANQPLDPVGSSDFGSVAQGGGGLGSILLIP